MTRTPQRAAPRRWASRLIVIALMLSGALVTIWPVVDTLRNNSAGVALLVQYNEQVAAASRTVLTNEYRAALSYNDNLNPRALFDPWSAGDPELGADHAEYERILSLAAPMARVRIPSINVDLPIFHDATDESMTHGAGHLYGSSLPVGGAGTHAVITAHASRPGRSYFDRLHELRAGDPFTIDVAGQSLTYRIDQERVVEPWELESVRPIEGSDIVTLVTCYTPPGEHRQRLLVRGTRVDAPAEPAQPIFASALASPTADFSILPWMWPRIVIAVGTLAIIAGVLISWSRAARRGPRARTTVPAQEGLS